MYRLLARRKKKEKKIGQPSFCEWVCCGLWPVGFRLDPVWRLFPSRRVRWSLGLELVGNCAGLGAPGSGMAIICFSCALHPSLHHGLQLKFSSAWPSWSCLAPGLGGTPACAALSFAAAALLLHSHSQLVQY
ncbi:hypothetical protein J3F84DRAFT_325272 [Trichoderma pleuroticola]